MAMQTKRRNRPPLGGGYYLKSISYPFSGGGPPDITQYGPTDYKWPAGLNGTQVTVSENHPGWRSRSKGKLSGDLGGPFSMSSSRVDGNARRVGLRAQRMFLQNPSKVSYDVVYDGICLPIDPRDPLVLFPAATASSDSLLHSLGAEAIAKAKPTNSVADLAVGLAEIMREGIPKAIGSTIWRSSTRKALKASSEEYLNVEFGWKPIIGDIKDIAKAASNAGKLLEQYQRDSGRVVRRRFNFSTEHNVTSRTILTNKRVYLPATSSVLETDDSAKGSVVLIDEFTRKRWFSGAFTYHLPSGYLSHNRLVSTAAKAEVLLGTNLTPEVVWNLTPWSWAVDWVSNIGDVLSNVSDWASDGLVLRYGYIMEHTLAKRTYTFVGPSGYRGDPRPNALILVTETKKRLPATPFGFGLTWQGFTSRQIAILTALGITRKK